MQLTAVLAIASTLISSVAAKNILLTNDDGWAATNIRAFYRDLKAAGHNVVMVAPAEQKSGNGGKFQLPQDTTLPINALFDYPPIGSPSWGHEEDDFNVWYFNGTPASCVAFGIDYVSPTYFNNMTFDIVVGGPNEGNNLGERDSFISGTIGASSYANIRGYPSIAFSGANSNNSFFKDNLDDDPEHAFNIYSKYSVSLLNTLFDSQGDNSRVLPLSASLNVNFSPAGTDINSNCTALTFAQTRFTGTGATTYQVKYNSTSNLMGQGYITDDTITTCVRGDCSLPSEFELINGGGCYVAVTVYTVDADAPTQLDNSAFAFADSFASKRRI